MPLPPLLTFIAFLEFQRNTQLGIIVEVPIFFQVLTYITLYFKLTPSLVHAQIYLPMKRTIVEAPLPLQVLKSRSIVDVKKIYILKIFNIENAFCFSS